jgi:hypothetical protein
VPVYAAWGKGSAEEQAELNKLYQKMVAHMGGPGTVAVEIFSSDLKPLKVVTASSTDGFLQTLQSVVSSLSLRPGNVLVKPRRQSLPQDTRPDDLALHLTARGFIGGASNHFPAESWIVYKASELPQILGPKETSIGLEWQIPSELAKRLLIHVYPQDISSDHPEANKILEQNITSRIISIEDGVAHARLDGHLTMNRGHAPHAGIDERIEASLVGYLDFDFKERRILALKLVTSKATSDGRDFMVGIISQPKNYAEPAAQ